VLPDLTPLVGLRVHKVTHAASMLSLGFATVDTASDGPAHWLLHVQCPWRIEDPFKVVTGSYDYWLALDGSVPDEDKPPGYGMNLETQVWREILCDPELRGRQPVRNLSSALEVTSVETTAYGDIAIAMTGGYRLRVFPSGSTGEDWRLFEQGDLKSHIVWPEEESASAC
jgi:hypothetical protein